MSGLNQLSGLSSVTIIPNPEFLQFGLMFGENRGELPGVICVTAVNTIWQFILKHEEVIYCEQDIEHSQQGHRTILALPDSSQQAGDFSHLAGEFR